MKKLLKTVLFLIILWASIFFGVEFICGFFTGNNYFKADLIDKTWAEKSYGYFVPNQNRTILFPGHKPYKLTINELGLRDTGSKNELLSYDNKILCVGDSFTLGLFVDDDMSYPYILQQQLEDRGYGVFNAGIGSTGIKDHWYYLKEKGISLDPDIVIMNFFGNDLDDIRSEVPYYQKVTNFKPEKWWVKSNFFRAILGLYVQSKYKRWLSKVKDPKVKTILEKRLDGVDNSLYVSWNYHTWKTVKDPYADELAPLWQEHLAYLKLINEYLSDRGIRFIYIINPELVSVFEKPNKRHEDILVNFMEVNNIEYINLVDVFKNHKDQILDLYNDPPRDFHLNKKGNMIVVDELMKHMGK